MMGWQWTGRSLLSILALVLLASAGCPEKKEGGGEDAASTEESAEAAEEEAWSEGSGEGEAGEAAVGEAGEEGSAPGEAPAEVVQRPLTAQDLQPVIQAVGTPGLPPSKIEIQFALPVVHGGRRANAKETRLLIQPKTEGELHFTSPSTLTFTPKQPFAPGKRYEVSLASVESRSGTITPPKPSPWVESFETPAFGLDRAMVERVVYGRRQASLKLHLTGPAMQSDLQSRLAIKEGGQTLTPVVKAERGPWFTRMGADARSSVFSVTLSGSAIQPARKLMLELAAGLPMAGEPEVQAKAASREIVLYGGASMDIREVGIAEGGNGFYLEVICDDDAVRGDRYYYDRNLGRSYSSLSPRCVLDEDEAAEKIHITPAVKFTTSPSGGGFRIFGDFQRGSYSVAIDAGARTQDGGVLMKDHLQTFSVPARKPQLRFVAKGRYLPRSSWKQIPIAHLNLEKATLTLRVVPEKNLTFWMSDSSESVDYREGDLVAQRTIPLKAAPDELQTTWVDVSDLVPPETRGLIELRLDAPQVSDTSRMVLTDLHLIAKRTGGDEKHPWGRSVSTWALGAEDGRLRSGVRVQLIRPSGKVIGECTTSSEEGCRIDLPEPGVDKTQPFALIARHGDDLSYLKFDELKVSIEDAQVHGEPFRSRRKYRAYLYSDRGVYRPGEQAHLMGLVRKEAGTAPKQGMPVRMFVTDPRGKKITSRRLLTDAAGLVSLDVRFAQFATTGHYNVSLMVAKRQVGAYGFQVEEFVPERMKVEAQGARPGFLQGEPITVAVGARYLFGGVPADHRVELSCNLVPTNFSPEGVKGFTFSRWLGNAKAPRPLNLGESSGVLDAEGGTQLDCPTAAEGGTIDGPAMALVRAAVFEAGSGRTTVGSARVMVHPEKFYIGLASKVSRVSQGKQLPVEGVVVDWEGKPYTDLEEITVDFYRLEDEWGWYYDEDEGSSYRYWRRTAREARQQVKVENGRFKVAWTPPVNARAYLVRAHAGGARAGLEVQGSGGYWYYWGHEESDSTPRPDKPSWLEISGPPKLEVGEKATFELTAPFQGRLLFTAETDELVHQEWREVKAGPQSFELDLEKFSPNVYVSALLFLDPQVRGSDAPSTRRAYGVQSFTVRPTEFTHELSLMAPKEVRSNSKLEVQLDLGPLEAPAHVTVAAVDEGILSLTKFQSPDPLPAIFVRRGLGVQTYETVGWSILLPPAGPTSSTGGDEDEEGGEGDLGRVQPVKPVALWSGTVKVDKSGKAKVEFDVPEYRGALRVMAVSADRERIGRAEAKVIVRDPLVVQATVPRFLTKDDQLKIPVFVTNVSGKPQDVKVKLDVSPLRVPGLTAPEGDQTRPVKVLGDGLAKMSLKDGQGDTVVFGAEVLAASGAAHFKVIVSGGGHSFEQNNDVPILPSGPKVRRLQTIELGQGETDLRPYLEGWVPLSERSTFWVTDNPYAPAFDHLKHLLRYPYGCIEQTTSSARPLLYLANYVDRVDPELAATAKAEDMVMAGIERIFSMQTPSGGFAYWPGGTDPQPWGTAYAIHFLLDAKKQRFPVDEARLNDAIQWLESTVEQYGRFDPRRSWRYYWGYYDEPYVHYVLALAGKGKKARAQSLITHGWWWEPWWWQGSYRWRVGANAEAMMLLKAAVYLSGDRRYEAELKSPDLTPYDSDYRSRGWSFYSDRRARAIALNIHADLFGDDPTGEPLARAVYQRLQNHPSGYYTTQELAWSVTGLGKRVLGQGTKFGKPELKANGKVLGAQPRPQADRSGDRSWAVYRASEYDSVKLTLPSKEEGKVYLVLASEGVRTDESWKLGGEGLAVTRTYYDASGSRISETAPRVKLGEVVYVKLTLSGSYPEDVNNVALVDRLPAGFEIENPRLGRGGDLSFLGDANRRWAADHMNVRDDRIEVFGTLSRNARVEVVYAVRATTAGVFTIPPVEAEAMYDPEIWARAGGGTLDVAGPWSE
ncbi:MAG: MG2 domain-containing protein [Deltaproteobacteria bacterium]|nr:MG2 domain-containing protein [Deltaproteobacteria bacterium]